MRECPDCGLAYSGDVDDHVCPDVDDFADEDDDLAEDTGEEEWSGPEDGPAYEGRAHSRSGIRQRAHAAGADAFQSGITMTKPSSLTVSGRPPEPGTKARRAPRVGTRERGSLPTAPVPSPAALS